MRIFAVCVCVCECVCVFVTFAGLVSYPAEAWFAGAEGLSAVDHTVGLIAATALVTTLRGHVCVATVWLSGYIHTHTHTHTPDSNMWQRGGDRVASCLHTHTHPHTHHLP